MLLKTVFRLYFCLVLISVLVACSDNPDTVSTAFPLASPARLTDFDATTLLVSDYAGQALHLVDKESLEPVKSIRFKGQPTGVAYHAGRYYVGNKSTRSVDVLDSEGRLLFHFGDRTGMFEQINDLVVHAEGAEIRVYVLDTKAATIRVFDPDGNPAGPDIGSGTLKTPMALAIDPVSGNILVSDFGTPGTPGTHESFLGLPDPDEVPPSLWIFDTSGNLLDSISGLSVEGGGGGMGWGGSTYTPIFSTPQGVSVDVDGNVYVVDAVSGEVQVFRLDDKTQLPTLDVDGTAIGSLSYPLDVWIDVASMDIFVADNRNGRVAVFRDGGSTP